MRRVRSIGFALTVSMVVLAGCQSDAANGPAGPSIEPPDPPARTSVGFNAAVWGDETVTMTSSEATWQRVPDGMRETTAQGVTSSIETTTLVLGATNAFGGPVANMIRLTLLGAPKVGTYALRTVGTPFGVTSEFIAEFARTVPPARRRSYVASDSRSGRSTGSITITNVGTEIRGTFAIRAGNRVEMPDPPPTGVSFNYTDATLGAKGSFVAAPGGVVIR